MLQKGKWDVVLQRGASDKAIELEHVSFPDQKERQKPQLAPAGFRASLRFADGPNKGRTRGALSQE